MKLITHLNAQLTEGDYCEPRGAVTVLHVEPIPGVHIRLMLGGAGLVFQRGDQKIALPLEAQIKLIARLAPEFLAVEGEESKQTPTPLQREIRQLVGDRTAKPAAAPAATTPNA